MVLSEDIKKPKLVHPVFFHNPCPWPLEKIVNLASPL